MSIRRGGNDFNLPLDQTDLTEEAEQYINTGGLNYDIFSKNSKQHLNIYSSAQLINRTNYAGAQQDTSRLWFNQWQNFGCRYAIYLFNGYACFLCRQYLQWEQNIIIDRIHDEILGYDIITDQTVNIESVYLAK